jgi:hypothetical protein
MAEVLHRARFVCFWAASRLSAFDGNGGGGADALFRARALSLLCPAQHTRYLLTSGQSL